MTPKYAEQEITFHDLEKQSLEAALDLSLPTGIDPASAFRQLRQIEIYARDGEMGVTVAVIEHHYIDRDYMEDHSIFYSRSLFPYSNYCQRAHLFRGTIDELKSRFQDITEIGRTGKPEDFLIARKLFSQDSYCGFVVIKPLSGTPVGRTVLRTYPEIPADPPKKGSAKATRHYDGAREYKVHLLGIELFVRGLAFQQQDVGVAACATTAIWTALQKTRESEELGPSTPAHITTKANQSSLPFGRSMPSEGLSIDQMCQAISSLGVSPVLTTVKDLQFLRRDLYTACRSALAPVLIIKAPDGAMYHAVAMVGMRLCDAAPEVKDGGHAYEADRLEAIYIHDDRFGPYLKAELGQPKKDTVVLSIRTKKGEDGKPNVTEDWEVTNVLVPMHAKVRLSITELYRLVVEQMGGTILPLVGALNQSLKKGALPTIDLRILRSHQYHERILYSPEFALRKEVAAEIIHTLSLSRYVGVIRFAFPGIGNIEVLVDTTSTFENRSYLGVVVDSEAPEFKKLAPVVAGELRCRPFGVA